MMNASDLRARRDRLAAELQKLDSLLSAFADYASEFAPELLAEQAPAPAAKPASRVSREESRPSVAVDLTADAVANAMTQENRPLTLAEIEQVVKDSGVPFPHSDNPRNAIGTRMNRSGRFVSMRGVGWWFKDRPMPIMQELEGFLAPQNERPANVSPGVSEAEDVSASSKQEPSIEETLG